MKMINLFPHGNRSSLRRVWSTVTLAFALVMAVLAPAAADDVGGGSNAGHVVMLDTTDVGSGAGQLETSFVAQGKTVIRKTPAEWAAMTTAEFASFDAIVLADPTCEFNTGETGAIAAASANAAVWGAAADGNVIIIGTDEQFHGTQGGQVLMDGAAEFVVADAAKTGAYVSLSCYFDGSAPGTPVSMLDSAFGSNFTVTDVPGCFTDAHIVAAHPAFGNAGVTDATLSDWGCSVHEAFDNWPINFEMLAIALTGTAFTAPDGSVGTPYILARGIEVISDIDLSPASGVNALGTSHTVTAVVTTDDPDAGTPVAGTTVTFEVIDGPHVGLTDTGIADGARMTSFAYIGTTVGIDTIEATFVDALGRTQRSNRVTKDWVEAPSTVDIELTKSAELLPGAEDDGDDDNGDDGDNDDNGKECFDDDDEGCLVKYTLTVTNNGPSDTASVEVNDGLPEELVFDSAEPSAGSYDSETGVWSAGALVNGESATLMIFATVASENGDDNGDDDDDNGDNENDNGGKNECHTIVNSADASSELDDPDLTNNTASATLLIGEDCPDQGNDGGDDAGNFAEVGIFAADIQWLAAQGITKGCNPPINDRFCPDDAVTRGQGAGLHAIRPRIIAPTQASPTHSGTTPNRGDDVGA